ncbi:MAG TPA: TetR/AcrR family transcriptional regulator [Nocardioides sp.]|nr:TetR/AcrR family transcriptional regulator [Nocardioides sp.]
MPKVTDAHRAARREQILDATLRQVAAAGFHHTTMADVIAASGLSAGAVYGYFRSKQDLIRAVAQRVVGSVASTIDSLGEGGRPVPPDRALETVLDRVLDLAEEKGYDVPAVAVQAWAEAARDPDVREILATQLRTVRESWRDYARRAREGGVLAPEADPVAVGDALMAMMPGFILFRVVLGDVTPSAHAAGIAELMRPRS